MGPNTSPALTALEPAETQTLINPSVILAAVSVMPALHRAHVKVLVVLMHDTSNDTKPRQTVTKCYTCPPNTHNETN